MDAIKAEIEKKRKLIGQVVSSVSGGDGETAGTTTKKKKVYLKRGEVERLAEELEQQKKAATNATKAPAPSALTGSSSTSANASATAAQADQSAPDRSDSNDDLAELQIPEEELRIRFRSRGQPIMLFGETMVQRIRRLKVLESAEERSEGQRNDFRSLLENTDKGLALELLAKQAGVDGELDEQRKRKQQELATIDTTVISPKLLEKDPERTRYLVGVYFKKVMHEWENALNARPTEEKRTTQGRLAAATQAQSAEYMKPFFRGLKQGTLPPDIIARITEIAMYMQQREYLKANDSYLKLSIGNAAWPIGVTMVGIHERSAREKISSSQVAHALNDETQRKWIQSIKRLMTFAQSIWPPDDLSKAIG